MSVEEGKIVIKTKARFNGNPPDDPLVVDAVRRAVRRYSRYNPLLTQDTMSLVEDQAIYDLPTDFLLLYAFDWWPTGEPSVSWSSESLWDRVYRAALLDAKAAEASPFVNVLSQKLVLSPVPEEDEDVQYSYLATHGIDEAGIYQTIPFVDEDLLVDLSTAELLASQQPELSLDEDFSEGLLQVRGRDRVGNTTDVIRALRRGVVEKYGGY